MENPIKMDDLGVPLFSETSICHSIQVPTKICFRVKSSAKVWTGGGAGKYWTAGDRNFDN